MLQVTLKSKIIPAYGFFEFNQDIKIAGFSLFFLTKRAKIADVLNMEVAFQLRFYALELILYF